MALYIRDSETEALVRALARKQKCSLNDAVKGAVREKLETLKAEPSLRDRLNEIAKNIARAPKTGNKADKKFFDNLSEHR
jgi:hypothetical protein